MASIENLELRPTLNKSEATTLLSFHKTRLLEGFKAIGLAVTYTTTVITVEGKHVGATADYQVSRRGSIPFLQFCEAIVTDDNIHHFLAKDVNHDQIPPENQMKNLSRLLSLHHVQHTQARLPTKQDHLPGYGIRIPFPSGDTLFIEWYGKYITYEAYWILASSR
jgi:hypothetical protein